MKASSKLLATGAAVAALIVGGTAIGNTSGTQITLTNQEWRCDRALSAYGPLPIRVTINYTNNLNTFGAFLANGCRGDANPATVDLILDIRGNGTVGPRDDVIRLANAYPGPRDMVISGKANCGRQVSPHHQDGIHAISGLNVTFRNFEIGNYDAGVPTCQGAGGAVFYSCASGNAPKNMRIEGGKFIGWNRALLDGYSACNAATGRVEGARFRSGGPNNPFHNSSPCETRNPNVVEVGITCQRYPYPG
jgi:hypothetical protein